MHRLAAALKALDNCGADPLIVAKCRGLIKGYHARWESQPYQVYTVEGLVTSDLWNPETQRKSRSFTIAGKLDATGYMNRRVIMDHKTTSEDITDPNGPFWRQLTIEGQVSHYMLLEWLNGRKVDEACWDVVRKPAIRPARVSKADQKDIHQFKRYWGSEISAASLEYLSANGAENHELYEARLAHDCTRERPQWYFARRTVPRLDGEIHEYASELWMHGQEILHARNTGRWPRNSGACMLYGSPCKFLGLCSGHDTVDSDHWRRKGNVHAELAMLEGDGRDVLTNSRIRCFQTCRRKHYLQYELGIERVDEEERDALVFGTTWHTALEAWFGVSRDTQTDTEVNQGEQHGNATVVPVNGIGTTGAETLEYF